MRTLPPYTEPADYKVNGEWQRNGKREVHSITSRPDPTVSEKACEFAIRNDYDIITVEVLDDPSPKTFWTMVHYLRDYGVPGVWKERVVIDGDPFRIGALYCIGPFELTERETNYNSYGESPYELEN